MFVVEGMLKQTEADAIKEWAVDESNPRRLARSSVGMENQETILLGADRTSDGSFDISTPEYESVGRRLFSAIKMDWDIQKYDGLEIVRYKKSQAYNFHLDAFDAYANADFNWDTTTLTGSNRYATMFMFLDDIPEEAGGQIIFSHATNYLQMVNRTEKSDRGLENMKKLFPEHRWEYTLAKQCFSGHFLVLRPKAMSALLLYSQDGMTGEIDKSAKHASCPVVTDTEKWTAGAWIWNNRLVASS